MLTRLALLAGFAVALPSLFACLDHPVKGVEYDKSAALEEGIAIAINKDVDVLFVIDNSGSMGEEQATLSNNFGAFVGVLEAEDVRANYRIGVTTTDMGNPRCGLDFFKAPSAGNLLLSSCRGRLGDNGGKSDFIFDAGSEVTDATTACTDYCSQAIHDALAPGIKPTSIEDSANGELPRKWLENIEGDTNLPDGVQTIVDGYPENNDADDTNDVSAVQAAFQCYGPQGINGCGFESPLQAMYFALSKAQNKNDPAAAENYGFLRSRSILSIVFVTDEADCSYTAAEIFTSNQTFWEPGSTGATSAVCWNAGVVCDGAAPGPYTNCRSVNFDVNGTELDPADAGTDANAVLIPVKRFTDQIQGIENTKKGLDQQNEVLVSLIGGVPQGYSTGEAEIVYLDHSDPDEQILFGIGPGCTTGEGGSAVPPVRLKEFAEFFAVGADRNIFSICNSDYTAALQAIANKIRDQIKPACFPECVADTDLSTVDIIDPSCVLVEELDDTSTDIPECIPDPDTGEYVPPAGVKACFIYVFDKANVTPSSIDDMSQECIDGQYNLEFKIVRSSAAPAGATVKATCELSELVERDCPGLAQ
ncbi:MAG: VWA domain-containing protein [Nannocystaceae bacterium]